MQLEIAPRVDTVQVVGSTIEAPATLQGSSVDVIPSGRVRSSNEPFAMDLLRYIPGVAFNQSGSPGGVTSLFLRGGNSNLNLVQIDGVPVNSFGGGFDFAHIPVEAVDHVDFIRGAQSAVYGSYANAGAIDFVTRRPESAPQLSLLAEGGSHSERRFGITGTGTVAGFGLLRLGVALRQRWRGGQRRLPQRRCAAQRYAALRPPECVAARLLRFQRSGRAGPLRLQSEAIFTGIDMVSRAKNNFSEYGAHYEADLSPRVRQELFGSFFLYNSGFTSPYGFSFNKDLRGYGRGAHDRQPVAARHGFLRCFGRTRVGAKQLYYGCRLLDISDRAQ